MDQKLIDDSKQKTAKQPVSVLVVIYNTAGQFLLLERADRVGFWQSVTGSLEWGETPIQAAIRETFEETGITINQHTILQDCQHSTVYEIYEHWRHRYAPGVMYNTEHWFSLCVPQGTPITLSAHEHTQFQWLTPSSAANRVFSPSNREAILMLAEKIS